MHPELLKNPDKDLPQRSTAPLAGRAERSSPAFQLNLARAMQMHLRLGLIVGIVVFIAVVMFAHSRGQSYSAQVIFYVPPQQPPLLGNEAPGGFDSTRYDATVQQLIETLQRPDVAEKAVRSLPPGVWKFPGESNAQAGSRLASAVTAQREGSSFQLDATLSGPGADSVALTLNALAQAFLTAVKQESTGQSEQRLAVLRDEATRVQASLEADRAQQAKLAASLGVAKLATGDTNPIDEAVTQTRQQLADLMRLRAMGGTPGDGAGYGDGAVSTTADAISQLTARKTALQSQMSGMTAANPIRIADEAELRSTDKELAAAAARYTQERDQQQAQREARERQRVGAAEAVLRAELARQQARAVEAAPTLEQYSVLGDEITRLDTRSAAIDEAIRGIELEQRDPGHIRVLVPATAPLAPTPGKTHLLYAASVPLAMIAAILAMAFAQKRDRRLFLASDVTGVLGFQPMASLPASQDVSEAVHEAYLLRLAAAIENSYRNSGARSFVFTAAGAESDVEELVFSVQRKLRELGYSALWVGSDTLLRAERDFEEAYNRGPRMDEAARFTDNGVEGLAAARLAWLKRDYDLVLVDAPPINISAEAEYAVRRCDAAILVNDSGLTTRDELAQAATILERIGLGGVGTVLKDVRLRDADLIFRNSVRLAEADLARRVPRDPRDDDGTWRVVDKGTDRELILPGDPVARVRRRRPMR